MPYCAYRAVASYDYRFCGLHGLDLATYDRWVRGMGLLNDLAIISGTRSEPASDGGSDDGGPVGEQLGLDI